MTLPHERTRAVIRTRQLLADLLDPKSTPRVPAAIRWRALLLLKHYPTAFDFVRVAPHEPAVFDEPTARALMSSKW